MPHAVPSDIPTRVSSHEASCSYLSSWRALVEQETARMCTIHVDDLILEHLICCGFRDVAVTFAEETKRTVAMKPLDVIDTVEDHIAQGRIAEALSILQETPHPTQTHSRMSECLSEELMFELHVQNFIECVRYQKVEEGIEWVTKYLAPAVREENSRSKGRARGHRLEEAVSLLLYEDPENDPMCGARFLMNRSRRTDLAKATTRSIIRVEVDQSLDCSRLEFLVSWMSRLQEEVLENYVSSLSDIEKERVCASLWTSVNPGCDRAKSVTETHAFPPSSCPVFDLLQSKFVLLHDS